MKLSLEPLGGYVGRHAGHWPGGVLPERHGDTTVARSLGWCTLLGLVIFITDPRPERLVVFFPSLVFGWLRTRTGDVLPGVFFHAACNLFSHVLAQGFGPLR